MGAPNLAHGFSPQETILDGLKAGYGYCGKIWKGKKTRQRNWEEKGLRMREVKKQRRNWAGMSTRNINKPATELARTSNQQPHTISGAYDLKVLSFWTLEIIRIMRAQLIPAEPLCTRNSQ